MAVHTLAYMMTLNDLTTTQVNNLKNHAYGFEVYVNPVPDPALSSSTATGFFVPRGMHVTAVHATAWIVGPKTGGGGVRQWQMSASRHRRAVHRRDRLPFRRVLPGGHRRDAAVLAIPLQPGAVRHGRLSVRSALRRCEGDYLRVHARGWRAVRRASQHLPERVRRDDLALSRVAGLSGSQLRQLQPGRRHVPGPPRGRPVFGHDVHGRGPGYAADLSDDLRQRAVCTAEQGVYVAGEPVMKICAAQKPGERGTCYGGGAFGQYAAVALALFLTLACCASPDRDVRLPPVALSDLPSRLIEVYCGQRCLNPASAVPDDECAFQLGTAVTEGLRQRIRLVELGRLAYDGDNAAECLAGLTCENVSCCADLGILSDQDVESPQHPGRMCPRLHGQFANWRSLRGRRRVRDCPVLGRRACGVHAPSGPRQNARRRRTMR